MKCIVLAAGYATRLYPLTEKLSEPTLITIASRGRKTDIELAFGRH